VPRAEKPIPCIAIFSAARDALIPALVIHRETIDDAVSEEAWRYGQNFMIRSNNTCTSDFTGDILKEYPTRVFQSDVHCARRGLKLWNFQAVLTFDNCFWHTDDDMLRLIASYNVKLETFLPHAANLFQTLDLVTLGVFKREKRDAKVKLALGWL
jgi:hypothetical protein